MTGQNNFVVNSEQLKGPAADEEYGPIDIVQSL